MLARDEVLVQRRGAEVRSAICPFDLREVKRHLCVCVQNVPENFSAGTLEVNRLLLVVVCLSVVPHLLLSFDHRCQYRLVIEDVSLSVSDPVAEEETATSGLKFWRFLRNQLVCHCLSYLFVFKHPLQTIDQEN